MKICLLLAIKIYWKIIPRSKRRCCLFKESCSTYVFRQTSENGFFTGMTSLLERMKKCKPGYQIDINNGKLFLILADNSILLEEEINKSIFKN